MAAFEEWANMKIASGGSEKKKETGPPFFVLRGQLRPAEWTPGRG